MKVTPSLLSALAQWRYSETFSTTLMDIRSMLHLSSLPYLRSLEVFVHENYDWDRTFSDSRILFPHLFQFFEVTVCDGIGLLVSFPSRVQLVVTFFQITIFTTPFTRGYSGRLFWLLTTNLSIDRLRCLKVLSYGVDPDVLVLDTIRPLFRFRSLASLDLSMYWAFGLSDAAMAELTSSFPLLGLLYLGNRTMSNRLGITYKSIVSVLKACPELHTLGISFDAGSITASVTISQREDDEEKWEGLNTRLSAISVGNSPIADPVLVALFLKTAMPRLTTVSPAGGNMEVWMRVESMLSSLVLKELKRRELQGLYAG
ncbi:hypothetical protein HYDPIDRAFT_29823 [Hydnomerulius pinastri MD-312]|uniref:F-box domain-containing protein n=1 Tax=Hydnomerulius pinastri MD-312 TaxID=994086 RepID=A0A0C9WE83_9AGAM|nr:hypothetical protein HYDPIDRAFT_29823 [Hydnomerulius pinastri MD-312]